MRVDYVVVRGGGDIASGTIQKLYRKTIEKSVDMASKCFLKKFYWSIVDL